MIKRIVYKFFKFSKKPHKRFIIEYELIEIDGKFELITEYFK